MPRSHPASPLTFTRSHRFFRCSSHRLRDADARHLEKLTPPHITWESSFMVELQMLTRAVFPLNVPAEKIKMRPLLSEARRCPQSTTPDPRLTAPVLAKRPPGPCPVLLLLLLPPLDFRTLTDRLTECCADCTNSDAYLSSSETAGVGRTSFKLGACCRFYVITGKHYISHPSLLLSNFNVFYLILISNKFG